MESPEVRKEKLIAQLIAAANKLIGENRIEKANYITVPDKNIEDIAKKFNMTVEKAQEMLKDYFASELNNK
jgi:enterochelin esterase-like enzyme